MASEKGVGMCSFQRRHLLERAGDHAGYLPWAFGAAKDGRADAFRDLLSAEGFAGKCTVTFAERRHPCFGIFTTGKELNDWLTARGEATVDPEGHECLWNGPSWPFATSLMLTALANLLASEEAQESITPKDYVFLLTQYASAHTITMPDGRTLPWIDENMDPDTGEWIARNRLRNWKGECFPKSKGGYERGKDYNHSTFCDLMLEGLFGIRPSEDALTVTPLFPADWKYACVSDVFVHGKELRITYRKGEGYRVFLDGTERFRADMPDKCRIAW